MTALGNPPDTFVLDLIRDDDKRIVGTVYIPHDGFEVDGITYRYTKQAVRRPIFELIDDH